MGHMRTSRLSQFKQNRLMEHFVAGTTARCAAVDLSRFSSGYLSHLRSYLFKRERAFTA